MRNVAWNILILSFSCFASAQVPQKCSAPPEYPHTRLHKKYAARQSFSSGEKIYFDCAEDFGPSRGSRAAQCFQGKWTKLTLKCEKKSCGNAGDLPHGLFEYEGNSYLGERVFAKCHDGYTLKGLNYMTCKKSGWTGEFPSCEVSSEGESTCAAPAVTNAANSSRGAPVQVGENVTFACSEGFKLDGAQLITCGPGGQWQPRPPRCLPEQDKTLLPDRGVRPAGGCRAPGTTSRSNADLADKYITLRAFASGDRVHYVCDVGYVPAGGSRYRKCVDGKWTPLLLRCERKPCGTAGEILNGQFIYSGVEFGDTATAVCDEGHRLVGHGTRNCMAKGWDGRVPVCEAVECEEPTEVTDAEMDGRREPPYTYRSVVRYRCRAGTLTGSKEIWCTRDGTWSAPPPTCQEITCLSPKIPGALWAGARNGRHQYRETLSIECHPGYAVTGPNIITCGSDGQWFPGLPRCTPTPRRHHWRG